MAKIINPIQTTIKDFKNLFSKEGLRKLCIDDLILLKAALDFGNEKLNELSETLSSVSIGTTSNKNRRNNQARNNISYNNNSTELAQPLIPATELSLIEPVSNFSTFSVSLYDAETEARKQNEMFLQTTSTDDIADEVEVLDEMFSSIQDE